MLSQLKFQRYCAKKYRWLFESAKTGPLRFSNAEVQATGSVYVTLQKNCVDSGEFLRVHSQIQKFQKAEFLLLVTGMVEIGNLEISTKIIPYRWWKWGFSRKNNRFPTFAIFCWWKFNQISTQQKVRSGLFFC